MKVFLILTFIVAAAISVLGQTNAEKVQKMAELFVEAYNAKDYAQIEQQFNSSMKTAVPADALKQVLDTFHQDYGKIAKLGSPQFSTPTVALFPVEFERKQMDLQIALDAQGKIGGLRFAEPGEIKPQNTQRNTSRNKTSMILPFKGEWFIFWGGDTVEQNYHVDAPTQRFAFDIVKVGADGKTHKGDGTKNEDYYAFGQEIVAPADGVVTEVINGVRDNKPGVMNPLMAVGNTVMIQHATGEVSVFAHLKYDSIRVKVGDKVTRGQVIGLCGNSGNSSEPHLHFQIQNTSLFAVEGSMKVFFEKVTVKRDGKTETKTDYSPVKGDIVSQN